MFSFQTKDEGEREPEETKPKRRRSAYKRDLDKLCADCKPSPHQKRKHLTHNFTICAVDNCPCMRFREA